MDVIEQIMNDKKYNRRPSHNERGEIVRVDKGKLRQTLTKSYSDGVNRGCETMIAVFFQVLMDKHDAKVEDLKTYFDEVNYYCDSLGSGRVSVDDLVEALHDDYGILITDGIT